MTSLSESAGGGGGGGSSGDCSLVNAIASKFWIAGVSAVISSGERKTPGNLSITAFISPPPWSNGLAKLPSKVPRAGRGTEVVAWLAIERIVRNLSEE